MKYWLKEFVKSHRWLYATYYYVMSFVINCIKVFVKPDDKLILFVSYGGKHYSDSPKNIFERMQSDIRFSSFHFVWAFVKPDDFEIEGTECIKIDTLKYFLTALKARVWITNVIIERALNFTGKNTFYLCTSHGIPLKSIAQSSTSFRGIARCLYDCCLAQSEFDRQLQSSEFGIPIDKIELLGYPRNDKFSGDHTEIIKRVRDYYGIRDNREIILYAPTYRDWNNGIERVALDINKWEKKLGGNFVLLYRAHPTVKVELDNKHKDFFINATSYEDLDDLLIAADILISDYSSMFFDYSIMHKPMICWAYDYDTFKKYRCLKVDLINEVYGGEISEDEVIDYIEKGDYSDSIKEAVEFQNKYVTVYGNATLNALDLIAKKVSN